MGQQRIRGDGERVRSSKRLAGVVALAMLAAGAAMVASAPSAMAAAPSDLNCATGANDSYFASIWGDTNTFTLSPASVAVGGTETVTWTSAIGPNNVMFFGYDPGTVQAQVVVALSGAMTGNVVATTAPNSYPAVETPPLGAFGGFSASASFTISGSGTLNATVSFIDFNSNTVDMYCSMDTDNTQFPAAGSAFVTSINTPNFQMPTGLPNPGDAGAYTGSGENPNYGDLQVSSGAVAFGSASASIIGPPSLTRGQVTGQITGTTAYAAASNTLNVTGINWPASVGAGGFTAQLCNTTLSSCDASAVVSNTLTSNASGNLSGGVVLTGTAANVTPGARALKVTATLAGATTSATYTILGTPTFTIMPAGGPPGTVTVGTAAGFTPSDAAVTFAAISNPSGFGLPNGTGGGCTGVGVPSASCIATGSYIPGPTNAVTAVTTSASGGWTGNITVADSSTNHVEFATKTVVAGAPFNTTPTIDGLSSNGTILATWSFDTQTCSTTEITGTSDCNTNQHVYASILAGSLTQAVSASANNPYTAASTTFNIQLCDPAVSAPITLANGKVAPCAVSVPTANQTYAGQLNPIVVTDTRGATVGWNLTAAAANLSDGGTHTIASSRLSITPACVIDAGAPGSASGVTAGAANQTFAGAVTLCTKNTALNAGGTTGGVWDISTAANGVSLAVPAFQAAGDYTTNMLINLA
jgi:hypothetical protein